MRDRRARDILLALVEGIHPHTGEALPVDSVLHSAAVLRALVAGATALGVLETRAARRAHLPTNVGRTWTSTEVASLRSEFEAGKSIENIAGAHARSVRAIEHRLATLGLLPATVNGFLSIEARRSNASSNGHDPEG